ncbi:MAG TPA: alcohol dehydrogenase catalytic domain-containing protein [Acidimicrobiales bacterium]|nr:alcohol dehydrogenase catalytic domain-containing protein [Acidimicrobiales bacterium]
MKTEAAILWPEATEWSVEEIDLDPPRTADEVLVRYAASGMCHSEEHAVTGDLPVERPLIGGHEGAGVVEAVGPGCTALEPGTMWSWASSPPVVTARPAPPGTRTPVTWTPPRSGYQDMRDAKNVRGVIIYGQD